MLSLRYRMLVSSMVATVDTDGARFRGRPRPTMVNGKTGDRIVRMEGQISQIVLRRKRLWVCVSVEVVIGYISNY